jgi:hypothetical protein
MNTKPRGYEPRVVATLQRSSADGNISYGALGQILFDNINMDLKKYGMTAWIGFDWLYRVSSK